MDNFYKANQHNSSRERDSFNSKLKMKEKKHSRCSSKKKNQNKKESSKDIYSDRKKLFLQDDQNNKEEDLNMNNLDMNKLKQIYTNENEISSINNNDKISKISNEQKSDFQMFNNKIIVSSATSFIDTDVNKPISVQDTFFLFFYKYFSSRELCLVCFKDSKKTLPYFIRWSCFILCLIIIFLSNCLFFTESSIHDRYLNALEGKSNNIIYYIKNELLNSVYAALICIVIKMIILKLVLKIFKIKKET